MSIRSLGGISLFCLGLGALALGQAKAAPAPAPAVRIDLDQAIRLALAHSPALAAVRAQIPQSQAQEITANLRPNPILTWDALYQPVFTPHNFSSAYLNNAAEYDAGVSYLFERGHKRQARLRAAQDATAVTRSLVADAGRGLSFGVAQAFVAALLAQSSLDFARQDLASWQSTVNISQAQYQAGAMSEGDLDTIKLQMLQYQTTVSGDRLALAQALSTLRQQVGFSALPARYGVVGKLAYVPVRDTLSDLQALALAHRPDLRASTQGITAAQSQYKLAQADGKRDLTASAQYTHAAGLSSMGYTFNIEIPVFDRNQGEIARTAAATTQAQDLAVAARQQVLTDVATALEAVDEGGRIVQYYTSGYRDQAKRALDIRQYSYTRGASSLLDLLDAERTYRTTELGYRQALAGYMLAVEQLKEAVGTRTLP
ncbi:MAG TPA: TolC family protein [Terriglobales bacterium]|nr:TolC family protein [Terriglobales bacterium]